MLFNEPSVIFIHIPKTGGSSIETFLHRSLVFKKRDGRMGQHAQLQRAYDLYGDINEFKIFTVMRNTYHRIISIYCMMYGRGGSGFTRLGFDRNPDHKHKKQFVSFPEYYNRLLEGYRDKRGPMLYNEDFFHYLNVNGEPPSHLEIINFDNLNEEFMELWKDKWGFSTLAEFKHINANKKVPTDSKLREYFLKDPKYIEVVEEIYEHEIQKFGFTPY